MIQLISVYMFLNGRHYQFTGMSGLIISLCAGLSLWRVVCVRERDIHLSRVISYHLCNLMCFSTELGHRACREQLNL